MKFMNGKFRWALSVMLCLTLILSVVPACAFANDANDANDQVTVSVYVSCDYINSDGSYADNKTEKYDNVVLGETFSFDLSPFKREGYSELYGSNSELITENNQTIKICYSQPQARYTIYYVYEGTLPENPYSYGITDYAYAGNSVKLQGYTAYPGYIFSGWSSNDVTVSDGNFTMPGHDVTFKGCFTADPNGSKYIVKHYIEDDNGDYALKESETIYAEPDTEVKATPKSFAGYEVKGEASGYTSPDFDLVLELYYTRKNYNISYKVDGETVAYAVCKYGDEIKLADEPTKTGYVFSGWSGVPADGKMPANDLTVSGSFKGADTSYTVVTYRQNLNGEYELYSREKRSGTVDEITKVTAPEVAGYKFRGIAQQKIKADGSTVVNIYYDLGGSNVKYTVKTYRQNTEGLYMLYSTETFTGAEDELTACTAPEVDGYTSRNVVQQYIKADGSTVVKIYYDLNELAAEATEENDNDTTDNDNEEADELEELEALEAEVVEEEAEETEAEAEFTIEVVNDVVEIEENETPLDAGIQESSGTSWWWIVLAVGAAAFFIFFIVKRRRSEEENAAA